MSQLLYRHLYFLSLINLLRVVYLLLTVRVPFVVELHR